MARDRAYLVILEWHFVHKHFLEDSLKEMQELASSAGGLVVGSTSGRVAHPSPSHFVREGKLAEIAAKAAAAKATVLIFNIDLTPGQARNIEEDCHLRVVDRTGLILDIFARRAVSHEGKLQVELAQLNYLLPRLVGQGVIMSRLGGGIGTRGPGEQKLEVDRRKIRARIQRIKKDLEKLERHRALLRSGRRQKGLLQIAIVGYTNAGKSTLLNALTGADAYIADQLFATLDPKTRVQSVNGRRDILFTDTVGFIRDLPHGLVESFHATLEEVTEADLLIHVVDAASPNALEEARTVQQVLTQLKAASKPTLMVLNKGDLLNTEERRRVAESAPAGAIMVSAKESWGLEALETGLMDLLERSKISVRPVLTDG